MPLDIAAASILEKNKLYSDGVWLVLLEIALPNSTTIYLTSNNEKVTWRGRDWLPFPFEIDDIEENTKGGVQSLNLEVSNVSRTLQYYVEQSGGATGIIVKLYFKMHKGIANYEAEVEEVFSVRKTNTTDKWITFTLGAGYPLSITRPEKRVFKNYCQFAYGDIQCGVTDQIKGLYPNCRRTLTDCRQRNNSTRFNGEPAIPGGLYLEES